MGGADEAVGDPIERVRGRLLPGAEFGRALAGDVAKRPAERAEASPPRLKCDVDNGHVGVAEQGPGPFDAPREQVAMRRQAKGVPERTREMRRRTRRSHAPAAPPASLHPTPRPCGPWRAAGDAGDRGPGSASQGTNVWSRQHRMLAPSLSRGRGCPGGPGFAGHSTAEGGSSGHAHWQASSLHGEDDSFRRAKRLSRLAKRGLIGRSTQGAARIAPRRG